MTYDKWYSIGKSNGYLVQYLKERDIQLKKSKEQLEDAFTPKIKSMLSKNIRDEIMEK